MADIYGANLYSRYLQACQHTKAQIQAKGGRGLGQVTAGAVAPEMTSAEQSDVSGVYSAERDLPETCSSILVCTGVYSKDEHELPSDSTHTVTEQRVFHGHRDFRFDPTLTEPSFIVHDVKDAVKLVFQKEGWPLE